MYYFKFHCKMFKAMLKMNSSKALFRIRLFGCWIKIYDFCLQNCCWTFEDWIDKTRRYPWPMVWSKNTLNNIKQWKTELAQAKICSDNQKVKILSQCTLEQQRLFCCGHPEGTGIKNTDKQIDR